MMTKPVKIGIALVLLLVGLIIALFYLFDGDANGHHRYMHYKTEHTYGRGNQTLACDVGWNFVRAWDSNPQGVHIVQLPNNPGVVDFVETANGQPCYHAYLLCGQFS